MPNEIVFTPEKLELLKKAYQQAVDQKQQEFIFDGNEYVVGYAKYLIEYLTDKFK